MDTDELSIMSPKPQNLNDDSSNIGVDTDAANNAAQVTPRAVVRNVQRPDRSTGKDLSTLRRSKHRSAKRS